MNNKKIIYALAFIYIFLISSCGEPKNNENSVDESSATFKVDSIFSEFDTKDSFYFFCLANLDKKQSTISEIIKNPVSNISEIDTIMYSDKHYVFDKKPQELLKNYINKYEMLKQNDLDEQTEKKIKELKEKNEFTINAFEKKIGKTGTEKVFKQAVIKNSTWPIGSTIKIKFLDGTKELKEFVKRNCVEWIKDINIKFQFVDTGNAEVRIAFNRNNANYSSIGTEARNIFNQSVPTMELYDLTTNITDEMKRALVLHEFGHCLGLVHEHQLPFSNIQWNVGNVYYYFKKYYNKDTYWVNNNILRQYNERELDFIFPFERNSIMIYPIAPGLANIEVHLPANLTETDKDYIKTLYLK